MTYIPTFSTFLNNLNINDTVYVDSLAAFPDAVNNVITLRSNTQYILSKPIDLGSNRFEISSLGQVVFSTTNTITNDITCNPGNGNALFSGDIARLVIQDVNIADNGGNGTLFDIDVDTATRGVVIHQRSFISGFASLGMIDNANSICNNLVFQNCDAGLTLTDADIVTWDDVVFESQDGDHIKITGDAGTVTFSTIISTPGSGDSLFDVSGVTVGGSFTTTGISLLAGSLGNSGLSEIVTTTSTLDNVIKDIQLNPSADIEVTLPDTSSAVFENGYTISFKDIGTASSNNINLLPNSGDGSKIQGLDNYVMDEDKQNLVLYYSQGNWFILVNSATPNSGGFYFNDNSTNTTISTEDVYTDIAGTATAFGSNKGFSFATSPNALTSIAGNTYHAKVTGNASVERTVGFLPRNITLALFQDTGSGYALVTGAQQSIEMSGSLSCVVLSASVTVSMGDKFKLMVRNNVNTNDIGVRDLNLTILQG